MSERQTLPPSTRVIYAVFDYYQEHKRGIFSAAAIAVVAGVLLSGLHIVKKEEQGVLTRFGRVVDANVGPGVHYHIPAIEKVYIRKVKRITRHQVSSKEGNTVNFTILSGDVNLLEVDLAIQYKIDNLRNYLFVTSDPLAMVTMYAREELINILGQNFIDLILTSNRNIIQSDLLDSITERLEARDIGIELVSLDIVDFRPIEETRAAFRDVSDAYTERVKAVSDANRKREQLIAHSRGQAEALVINARAKARERLIQAQSSAGVFTALLAEYKKHPAHVSFTRYWDRMRQIFSEASLAAVNPGRNSTIDINMIDGGAGFTPADMALGAPPSAEEEAVDRPLLSSALAQNVHSIESVDADKHLRDGQFHSTGAERDHMAIANPRSLIFDTPSIFSHRHVARIGKPIGKQADAKPMIEKLAAEGKGDGKSEKKEKTAGKPAKKTKPGGKPGKKKTADTSGKKEEPAGEPEAKEKAVTGSGSP